MMLANQPYTLLRGAVYIHPTFVEGFFALMDDVNPLADRHLSSQRDATFHQWYSANCIFGD